MKHGLSQSIILIFSITLFLISLKTASAVPMEKEQDSPFQIVKIDCSWFPMVKATVYSKNGFSDDDNIALFENEKEIKAFRRISSGENGKNIIVKWLSRVSTAGTQNLTITMNDLIAKHTFSSFKSRRFGDNIQQAVKILTYGPDEQFFPCRIIAFHENGEVFDDISSKGGYGRLGSGFSIPSGNLTVELRLLSPDTGLDHFTMFVKPSQPKKIERFFGFLKLPYSECSKKDQLDVHIEIEGKRLRYPAIQSNLFTLYSKLAKLFPTGVIPLPEGKYMINLLPATGASKQERKTYEIEIINGSTSEIDMSPLKR